MSSVSFSVTLNLDLRKNGSVSLLFPKCWCRWLFEWLIHIDFTDSMLHSPYRSWQTLNGFPKVERIYRKCQERCTTTQKQHTGQVIGGSSRWQVEAVISSSTSEWQIVRNHSRFSGFTLGSFFFSVFSWKGFLSNFAVWQVHLKSWSKNCKKPQSSSTRRDSFASKLCSSGFAEKKTSKGNWAEALPAPSDEVLNWLLQYLFTSSEAGNDPDLKKKETPAG